MSDPVGSTLVTPGKAYPGFDDAGSHASRGNRGLRRFASPSGPRSGQGLCSHAEAWEQGRAVTAGVRTLVPTLRGTLVPTRKRGNEQRPFRNEQRPFGFRQPLGWTAVLWLVLLAGGAAVAQESADPEAARAAAEERLREAETRAEAALADRAADEPSDQAAAQTPIVVRESKINLLDLLVQGGWLMIPIAAMSFLVVAFGAERFLGLRRGRVLPTRLIRELQAVAAGQRPFDPWAIEQLCRRYRSSASRIIRAMLLKIGRPQGEVEGAISQASEREAARLYSNVRWLSLAAGIAPLLGLLGTVWGMIEAFFRTTELPVGANKAEFLAKGIYMALVTTFAGLAVAIPAAVLAHYFEGRIQKLLHRLDEVLIELHPKVEHFEGRGRPADPLVGPDARSRDAASRPPAKRAPTSIPK